MKSTKFPLLWYNIPGTCVVMTYSVCSGDFPKRISYSENKRE